MTALRKLWEGYTVVLRSAVYVLAGVSGLGLLTMMAVTCIDVGMGLFGRALFGAFDIIRMAGALTIAGALPYTTAIKGHVAIEYFFHKLSRRGRIVVDTAARLLAIALFVFLAWRSVIYGDQLRSTGTVSLTLEWPIFWIPWVIAVCCGTVALVIGHNLVHPGREMIKP